jgi:hypothetical protein
VSAPETGRAGEGTAAQKLMGITGPLSCQPVQRVPNGPMIDILQLIVALVALLLGDGLLRLLKKI